MSDTKIDVARDRADHPREANFQADEGHAECEERPNADEGDSLVGTREAQHQGGYCENEQQSTVAHP